MADHVGHKPDRMEGLDASFRGKLQRVLERMRARGFDAYVAEGYRTPERQNELYAQGRTRPGRIVTKAKHSKHSERIAADIVSSSKGWKPDEEFWKALSEEAKREGLVWGGDFLGLVDKPHVELRR